jgi:hypothetical protein
MTPLQQKKYNELIALGWEYYDEYNGNIKMIKYTAASGFTYTCEFCEIDNNGGLV